MIIVNNSLVRASRYCLVCVLLFLFQCFASKTAGVIAGFFDYSRFDSDNTFMYISIHHIFQMLFALFLIFLISHVKKIDFNLKPRFDNSGVLCCILFSIIIFIYVVISYIVGYSMGTIAPYSYELNFINVFGTLAFQLFLSGVSEEILFRALPITILKSVSNKNWKYSYFFCIFISSIFFALAHIKWSLFPFSISYSMFQLVYAFILGLAYGYTYLKSKCILYPMIMHGISNFLMVGIGYIFSYFIM